MVGIRIAAATAACAVVAVLAATGASGQGKPANTCPPAFDLGRFTFQQTLALPRTQAALEAGLVTVEDLQAGFSAIDRNANGRICVQLPHGLEVSQAPFANYFYNAIDDNASTPN